MINITFYDTHNANNDERVASTTVQVETGQSLMTAAVNAGIDAIAADCGGTLTCATCHVIVRQAWADKLPTITEEESNMLDFAASPRQGNSRLSCQIELTPELNDMEVDLPLSQY